MSQQQTFDGGGSPLPDIETLTPDVGGAVTSVANNINVQGTNGTLPADSIVTHNFGNPDFGIENRRWLTPFVVDPSSTVGERGTYATIQAAVDAAVAAGGISQCIMVRPGQYTEDIDFSAATALTVGLTLVGVTALGDEGQCEIVGTHIPPDSGTLVLRNFRLSDATAIFSSAAAGAGHLVVIDAEFNVTNGYSFDLLNWTGILEFFDTNPGTGEDGFINNTGGAEVFMFSAGIGAGTTNTMNLSGTIVIGEGDIGCPVDFGTGSVIAIDVVQFSQAVTFSGDAQGSLNMCRFTGGASAAITMSSTGNITVATAVVDSSNDPAIDGAGSGTFSYADLVFYDNANLAGTLTTAVLDWKPWATAGTSGAAIKGVASYDEDDFTVTNGFVEVAGKLMGTATVVGATTGDIITFDLGASAAVYRIIYTVAGRETTSGDGVGYTVDASVRTDGATASVIATPFIDSDEDTSLTAALMEVVASGNNAILRATGVAASTIDYKAVANYVGV